MDKEAKLSAERLRSMLSFDPDTGHFTWKQNRGGTARAGSRAGSWHNEGYRQIVVGGSHYLAHRAAWLYMTGEWPQADVDHINGDRSDNRWCNLRSVTRSINLENQRKARTNSKTGALGVTVLGRRFRACIQVEGRNRHLGCFDTVDEASTAYLDAKRRLHVGCTI